MGGCAVSKGSLLLYEENLLLIYASISSPVRAADRYSEPALVEIAPIPAPQHMVMHFETELVIQSEYLPRKYILNESICRIRPSVLDESHDCHI